MRIYIKDNLYKVHMKNGLCQYPQGALKGPCKHKGIVSHKYKMKNFDILPEENTKMRAIYKFPLAPMGVLAPGSAHARPSAQPPIDVSGNFPAPVSAEWPSAFKTVPIFRSN